MPGRLFHVNSLAVLLATVPGKQTVPRAETWAVAKLAEQADQNALKRNGVDASYVVNGFAAPAAKRQREAGANGDVWKAAAAALDDQEGCQMHKVPAHVP